MRKVRILLGAVVVCFASFGGNAYGGTLESENVTLTDSGPSARKAAEISSGATKGIDSSSITDKGEPSREDVALRYGKLRAELGEKWIDSSKHKLTSGSGYGAKAIPGLMLRDKEIDKPGRREAWGMLYREMSAKENEIRMRPGNGGIVSVMRGSEENTWFFGKYQFKADEENNRYLVSTNGGKSYRPVMEKAGQCETFYGKDGDKISYYVSLPAFNKGKEHNWTRIERITEEGAEIGISLDIPSNRFEMATSRKSWVSVAGKKVEDRNPKNNVENLFTSTPMGK